MKPTILQIPVGQMANFTYIIADEESGDAAIIDPSWDLDLIFHALKKNGWRAKYIINTHTHFDHVLGNDQVAGVVGAKIVQHKNSQLEKHVAVSDGDVIEIGSIRSSRNRWFVRTRSDSCRPIQRVGNTTSPTEFAQ